MRKIVYSFRFRGCRLSLFLLYRYVLCVSLTGTSGHVSFSLFSRMVDLFSFSLCDFFEYVFRFGIRLPRPNVWAISQWQQNSFLCTKWPILLKRFGKCFSSCFSSFLLCVRFFRPVFLGLFFLFRCWKVAMTMCVTTEVLKVRCRLCTRSLIQNSFLFSKWNNISVRWKNLFEPLLGFRSLFSLAII